MSEKKRGKTPRTSRSGHGYVSNGVDVGAIHGGLGTAFRKCNKKSCGKILPESSGFFFHNTRTPSGYHPNCRNCLCPPRDYIIGGVMADYCERLFMPLRTCTSCGKTYLETDDNFERSGKTSFKRVCRACSEGASLEPVVFENTGETISEFIARKDFFLFSDLQLGGVAPVDGEVFSAVDTPFFNQSASDFALKEGGQNSAGWDENLMRLIQFPETVVTRRCPSCGKAIPTSLMGESGLCLSCEQLASLEREGEFAEDGLPLFVVQKVRDMLSMIALTNLEAYGIDVSHINDEFRPMSLFGHSLTLTEFLKTMLGERGVLNTVCMVAVGNGKDDRSLVGVMPVKSERLRMDFNDALRALLDGEIFFGFRFPPSRYASGSKICFADISDPRLSKHWLNLSNLLLCRRM